MIELLVGAALALGAMAFVLHPLFARPPATLRTGRSDAAAETSAEVTDEEVEALIRAHRHHVAVCVLCGPRPEPDAIYCSRCGGRVAAERPPGS